MGARGQTVVVNKQTRELTEVVRVQNLVGHSAAVRVLAMAPSGHMLASGGDDGTVRVWQLVDHDRQWAVAGDAPAATAAGAPADGTAPCAEWVEESFVLPVFSPTPVRVFKGHVGPVTSLAWSEVRDGIAGPRRRIEQELTLVRRLHWAERALRATFCSLHQQMAASGTCRRHSCCVPAEPIAQLTRRAPGPCGHCRRLWYDELEPLNVFTADGMGAVHSVCFDPAVRGGPHAHGHQQVRMLTISVAPAHCQARARSDRTRSLHRRAQTALCGSGTCGWTSRSRRGR